MPPELGPPDELKRLGEGVQALVARLSGRMLWPWLVMLMLFFVGWISGWEILTYVGAALLLILSGVLAISSPPARSYLRFCVIVAAFVLGTSLSPENGGMEYYAAASQIIPVLILALALQDRAVRILSVWSWDMVYLAFVYLLMAGGEFSALRVLAGSDPGRGLDAGGAIAAGLAAIVLAALFGPWHVGAPDPAMSGPSSDAASEDATGERSAP